MPVSTCAGSVPAGSVTTRHQSAGRPPAPAVDAVAADLSRVLFAPFRRRDQRRKAEMYFQGLLTTSGRKSVRNIAAHLGDPGAEQGLHHFISCSTWDWRPMRAALAAYTERLAPAQAWVVRSMHIPKAGEHSVGVDRLFAPQLGQLFSGQQAIGVWYASERLSAPVHWRLLLTDPWVSDPRRRDRAEVPEKASAESLEQCTAEAVLEVVQRGSGVARRPVVLDVRGGTTAATLTRLSDAGVPVLARVTAATRLAVADRALPGFRAGLLCASQILEATKGLRRPVSWPDPAGAGAVRSALASVVRVTVPDAQGRRHPMLLLGEWSDPNQPPSAAWLTNLSQSPVGRLVRLTRLPRRVETDFAEIGEPCGLRDFMGRSFPGWHRHVTLASAAHTAMSLARADHALSLPPQL
ncbi:transposase [Streptomyces sp. ST1015]|uniref:IS701 family transposase n=2 Tax=Streptomyces niveiscabiei TaxID=164115 RepID=A0ABW9HQX1_9ACTN|nr:transposase [Streptomyces sp. ST1015]